MTDASTAHGREPTEPINPEPFFPSEGAFSTVVPLSEVGRTPASYRGGADAGRAAEADWAREDRRRDLKSSGEEETLVPARLSAGRRARRAGSKAGARQSWAVTSMALALSVVAGLAAGAYLVRSQQSQEARRPAAPVVEAATSEQVASEEPATAEAAVTMEPAPPWAPEPEPNAPEVAATSAAVASAAPAESSAPATKTAAPAVTNVPRAAAAEPAERRDVESERRVAETERRAVENEPRVERRARAEAGAAQPAPKPARREAAPRREAAATQPRPPRAAPTGRALPVSAPPPSAKSRTVIQWP